MRAAQAAKAVEIGLYNAWVGRTGYQLGLGTKHLALDPADVITVQKGADEFLMRILQWQLEDGFTTMLSAQSEDTETYTSYAEGQDIAVTPQSFGPPGATQLHILDIPLLRDVDDPNQLGTGAYVAFGRYLTNWRGAVAQVSTNGGGTWDLFSISRDSAPWGYLEGDVAALSLEPDNTYPSEIQRLDEVTEIDVQVVADSEDLEEITRLELWARDSNAMVVGTGDSAEVIRYQNFTDLGGGTFRFYNLLRGRRGTEEAALAGHTDGDFVVFVNKDNTNREGLDLARIARTDFYRGVSIGEFVDATIVRSHVHNANDLKPYSVARPAADNPPGAARAPVTITWVRRTRLGGQMDLGDGIQQTEVPGAEVTESYEVDLLHKTTGLPVVTKTATDDSFGVSFSGADHTTGGYSDGDPLDVVIYQISAVVGRGRPNAVTL
jgi:hypothetical protein